jgi:hypothetical protein
MFEALIGGAALAAAMLVLAALKRNADRGHELRWMKSESVQSIIAVGLVAVIALGAATVISTAASGWPAPSLGFAVALSGLAVAVIYVGRAGRRR